MGPHCGPIADIWTPQYIVIIDDLSPELHHGFSHKYSLKVEEYFDVFRCQCDAWSSLGQTSSRAATVATGCKFVAMMDMIKILKESMNAKVPCLVLFCD